MRLKLENIFRLSFSFSVHTHMALCVSVSVLRPILAILSLNWEINEWKLVVTVGDFGAFNF